MAVMSGPASVTSRPKSPEMAGLVSSGLRRSIPPVSQHGEFISKFADFTMTSPFQRCLELLWRPPPDSSSGRLSQSASQTYLPPPFPRPSGQPILLPQWCNEPCLLNPNPSISSWTVPEVSIIPQKILDKLPMTPNRHVGGEPEGSSGEDPPQFETSENGRFATAIENMKEEIERQRLAFLSDEGLLEPTSSHLGIDLLLFAKEDEPDGSGGFSSDTTRTGRILSNRDYDDNKPYCSCRTPYNRPREMDRHISNPRPRSSGRMGLIPPTYSLQAASTIITFDFSNRTSDFLRCPSYWEGAWDTMQNASVDSLLSFEYLNSPYLLNFSVRTTQGTLVLQKSWTMPVAFLPPFLSNEPHRESGTQYDPLRAEFVDTPIVPRFSLLFSSSTGIAGSVSGCRPSFKNVVMIHANETMRYHLREKRRHIYVPMWELTYVPTYLHCICS